jgi:hypothetical protein|tara:strand:+ start:232 stop:468 length:237 start_codon:yes stop_codon:yes gene_type:complete
MAVRLYKGKNSKMVRGLNVQAHLDTGWTVEPVKQQKRKTKTILPKLKLEVGEVKVVSENDLSGPKDLNNKGENKWEQI